MSSGLGSPGGVLERRSGKPREGGQMNEEALSILGIGIGLVVLGAWGAFGPEKWNPLALKGRFRQHVRPSLAKALRVLIGGMILLVGLAATGTGVSQLMK